MTLASSPTPPAQLREQLSREVTEVLDQLAGDAVDTAAVAGALARQGFAGEILNAALDPLAQYISRQVHAVFVSVYPHHVTISRGNHITVEVPMPDLLSRFVYEFDNGEHPDVAVTRG